MSARRIAYVVNAPAENKGVFQQMQFELLKSISGIGSKQYFVVLAAGEGKPKAMLADWFVHAKLEAKIATNQALPDVTGSAKADLAAAVKQAYELFDTAEQPEKGGNLLNLVCTADPPESVARMVDARRGMDRPPVRVFVFLFAKEGFPTPIGSPRPAAAR